MIDRSIKPEPQKEIEFLLPKIHELSYPNGLKISFVKKSNLPIVQFSVLIYAGGKLDPEGKSGLAYLTSMLIDEGAAGQSALEIDNEIETLGSVLKINTNKELIKISLLTLKENLEQSFKVLASIIQSPNFTEADFNRCKKEQLTKILQSKDDPSYLADSIFTRVITQPTVYSYPTMGFIDTVNNISNEDVKQFHSDYFFPSNMHLVAVGDIDNVKIDELISKYLTFEKTGYVNFVDPMPPVQKPGFYLIHKNNSAQSEIRMGHLSGKRDDNNYYSKKLMNLILGGQFSSRIMANLREDKGYTYGASSYFSYFKPFSEFEISTGVQTENTVNAIKEILKELKGIQENISDEEAEYARSYIIKRYPSEFQTNSQIAGNVASLILHSLPLDYYNTYLDRIKSVDKEMMLKSAKEQIHIDKLAVVIVGDKKVVKEELEKEFGVSVIELDSQGKRISQPKQMEK